MENLVADFVKFSELEPKLSLTLLISKDPLNRSANSSATFTFT